MGQDFCIVCDRPTTNTISAPADTGPFTHVEFSDQFTPTDRWDMPVCPTCAPEHLQLVACATCHRLLPRIDTVNNGFTVTLCRPCNSVE